MSYSRNIRIRTLSEETSLLTIDEKSETIYLERNDFFNRKTNFDIFQDYFPDYFADIPVVMIIHSESQLALRRSISGQHLSLTKDISEVTNIFDPRCFIFIQRDNPFCLCQIMDNNSVSLFSLFLS